MVRKYIYHIKNIKRYSPRTVEIYDDILRQYFSFALDGNLPEDFPHISEALCRELLTAQLLRGYEVSLLEPQKAGRTSRPQLSARTVNQHLSCLSAFCRYLIKQGVLTGNPVKMIARPKQPARIPQIVKEADISEYLASVDVTAKDLDYDKRLSHLIVTLLFTTGIRRAELLTLRRSDYYASRKVIRVHGKGDKIREIPLVASVVQEINLYLEEVRRSLAKSMFLTPNDTLLVTKNCRPLYPQFVERVVKKELGPYNKTSGRLSPHALRHSLATELLDDGADLLSIKELLGHSSLAATQVYTHSSIAKLKDVYSKAHPLAKK